jgi:hypothetical protein
MNTSRTRKQAADLALQPLGNVWHKAVSKNPEEREDGRDGLALLFLLFENTLDLKAEEAIDPLADLLFEPQAKIQQTVQQLAIPWILPGTRAKQAAK